MSAVQDRLDATLRRADDLLRERTKRELAALERQDAAEREAQREQARADAFRRTEIAAKYDEAFAALGLGTPEAIADERPGQYRRRLFELLQRRLPSSNEWSGVRADDLPPSARGNVEALVIAAAKVEAASPSIDNLPRDGSMVARTRSDDTGLKVTEYFGRESFIKSMGRAGRSVLRIVDPRTMTAIWGKSFSRAG